MGFFTPGNSKNWYIAIWYKKIASGTIVWVANRENPLPNSSSVLKLIDPKILVLLNSTNNTIWSSNTSRSARNPVDKLLDSGNLIIQDPNNHTPENFLWQIFDYSCNTLLPGMKIGRTWLQVESGTCLRGRAKALLCCFELDLGMVSGSPALGRCDLLNSSVVSRFILTPNGFAQRWTMINQNKGWVLYVNAPTTVNCSSYNLCGAYGSYDDGVGLQEWRWVFADCKNGDGFLQYSAVKLSDTQSLWYNRTMTLGECRAVCLKNCSCMAYTSLDIRGGGEQDIYTRMASSKLVAWRLYEEGKSMELVDGFVRDSCCLSEVLRSIHMGLLCVQHPEDKPTMSSVVMMLGSEGELPWPKQPGFFY
ncbi:unnamed protein product [Camellia sinensis]